MMNEDLKIMVGASEMVVEASVGGSVWFASTDGNGFTAKKQVSAEDAALLVLHLVGKLPIFSDKAFYAVEEDVAKYRGRLMRNQKVETLMKNLSAGYFQKDLSRLSGNEFELVRRTAEAEVAVAEAKAKAEANL